MPTLAEAARLTTRDGAVWRPCRCCGLLAAMPPEIDRCHACTPRGTNTGSGLRTRRRAVAALAAPAVRTAREVYSTVPSDSVRVAALVEIAAAACLARTVVRLRRLNPALIAPLVSDGTDLRAVLGRGRWLPTMTRHIAAPGSDPVDLAALLPAVVSSRPPRRTVRRRPATGQTVLFLPGEPRR